MEDGGIIVGTTSTVSAGEDISHSLVYAALLVAETIVGGVQLLPATCAGTIKIAFHLLTDTKHSSSKLFVQRVHHCLTSSLGSTN